MRLGGLAHLLGEQLLEAVHHQIDQLRGRCLRRQRIGFRKQVALEIAGGRIGVHNRHRVARRFKEGGGRAELLLLEDLRHLEHVEAFGERQAPHPGVAFRDLLDDLHGRHRRIEAIGTRLQRARCAGAPQRRAERRVVPDHAAGNQPLADGARVAARRNLHELLAAVALVRLADALIERDAHPRGRNKGEDNEKDECPHG